MQSILVLSTGELGLLIERGLSKEGWWLFKSSEGLLKINRRGEVKSLFLSLQRVNKSINQKTL